MSANTMQRLQQCGFTLLELLVAIAIFSVLSLTGWWVFDQTLKVRERNTLHETRLLAVQRAYGQMYRDTLQVRRTVYGHTAQAKPAFELEHSRMSFSKGGVLDPLQQGLAPDERIEYRFDASRQVLERHQMRNLRAEQPEIQSAVVLDAVSQVQFTALDPEVKSTWPLTMNEDDLDRLPKGIRMELVVDDVPYEWIFALPPVQRSTPEHKKDQPAEGENENPQDNGQQQNQGIGEN